MASLTIPDLPEDVHARLRERARKNARSVEAEARALLEEVVEPSPAKPFEPGAWLGSLRDELRVLSDWEQGDREVEQMFEESINNPNDPLYARDAG